MIISDIARILEAWAPPSIAWEHDNVGLQIGSPKRRVRAVLVALDLTDAVIDEARARRADLVVTHHPMLFRPLRSVNTDDRIGRMTKKLLRSDIALYAAHTNLDFTSGGVSIALAEKLGLEGIRILSPTSHRRLKLVTFVPPDHVESVREALSREGAGVIGEYSSCSFSSEGAGTFQGSAVSRPSHGSAGRLERLPEHRLEMIVDEWDVARVTAALRKAHPYEEVAYDLYRLENAESRFGAGAIGTTAKPVRLRIFLERLCSALAVPVVRYSGDPKMPVRTVALCGGSGSDLLGAAIAAKADAFVTADIRYHSFEEPDGRIALVDAGHFETERPIVETIVRALKEDARVKKEAVQVIVSRASKNPVQYFSS